MPKNSKSSNDGLSQNTTDPGASATLVQALMDCFLHQDRLVFGVIGWETALQGGVFYGYFVLEPRGWWWPFWIALAGAIITVLVILFVRKGRANQHVIAERIKGLAPGALVSSKWPKGGHLLYSALVILEVMDLLMVACAVARMRT